MAETYDISRRKTASILDTFSCVFQGVIPYGAQMLVAISAAAELGYAVSAFQIATVSVLPVFAAGELSSQCSSSRVPDKRGARRRSVAGGRRAACPPTGRVTGG